MALTLLANFEPFLAFAPQIYAPPILSPYEILKLVGFATGAALHLYLCWMILRRYGIRRVERSLFGLGLSIGLWHLGNFAGVIYDMLLEDNHVEGGWWVWRGWLVWGALLAGVEV